MRGAGRDQIQEGPESQVESKFGCHLAGPGDRGTCCNWRCDLIRFAFLEISLYSWGDTRPAGEAGETERAGPWGAEDSSGPSRLSPEPERLSSGQGHGQSWCLWQWGAIEGLGDLT